MEVIAVMDEYTVAPLSAVMQVTAEEITIIISFAYLPFTQLQLLLLLCKYVSMDKYIHNDRASK